MHGKILIYGNDLTLISTRHLVLERAGYRVLSATQFASAMLGLMNEHIDVLILCHSLRDEERRAMLETAHAITPDVKCVVLSFNGCEVPPGDAEVFEGLHGPTALLTVIGRILNNKVLPRMLASR